MANTIDDYTKARKLGNKEYQKALSEGHYPYLPALDYMLGSRTTMAEEYVGIKEIPLSLVVGTVTQGRQDSFARNFMPILPPETEFGQKWINLMDYQTSHGISDAIKATEFMGKFYVLEGNKRVSVLKFLEQPTIMAEVTRVLPPKSDDIEVIIYYEFLKFYKCTGIYDITFSESGCYEKLAEAVGKDLESPWDEDTVKDLKSAFLNFTTAYMGGGGKALSITIGDAFLIYIGIYKFESLINTPADEIKKNLTPIWQEIRIKANGDQIAFSEEPQLQKKTVIPIIDTLIKKPSYSEKNPLKILFLYDGDSTKSRWINGHEQGRKYLEEKFPGIVKTLTCDCKTTEEEFDEAVEAAAEDGADMIITTSPIQMEHALRAAVKHPNIKFMNCSVHISHGAVRTYYGRMYEAKFVLGVLAATLSKDHRIGYVSTYPICGNIANINAFAMGAAMIDPEAKIYLTWSCLKEGYWREFIKENGLKIVSGPDLIKPQDKNDNEYGLYQVDDNGEITNLAFPVWNWGKYYELIVQTILNDAWDAEGEKDKAVNYWWGMSSGVIDVFRCDTIPYSTNKLVKAIQKTITADLCNPFDGELRSQDGLIKPSDSPRLSNEEIINMNWLNDNVIGSIPGFDELTEKAQQTVRANGMPIVTRGEITE